MPSSDEDASMFTRTFTNVAAPGAATVARKFDIKLRANLAINKDDKKMKDLFAENKIQTVVALKARNREKADEHLKGTKGVLEELRLELSHGDTHHYDFLFEGLKILKVGTYFFNVSLHTMDDDGKWKVGMNAGTGFCVVTKPPVPGIYGSGSDF
jgi:hypothetical protein